jgi:hypothetical protein
MTADKPTKPTRNPDELSRSFGDFLASLGLLLEILPRTLSQEQAREFRRDVSSFTNKWFKEMVREQRDGNSQHHRGFWV